MGECAAGARSSLSRSQGVQHSAVVTDFGAGRTTYGTAINGTDAIGGFAYMNLWGERLAPFVQNGSVPEAVLDDKLVRILTPFYALDQESLPEVDYDRWVANKTSAIVAREVTEGAITLLKNSNETGLGLPIKGVTDVAREYTVNDFPHV